MVVEIRHQEWGGAYRIGIVGCEAPRVVLVGECNPHADEPMAALWASPGTAGGRLQSTILGLEPLSYYGLWRVNLCPTRTWDTVAARMTALRVASPLAPWEVVVCLGRRVARRMAAARGLDIFPSWSIMPWGSPVYVTIPHPSGRCRDWNDSAAIPHARELLRRAAPEVPWGELDAQSS